MFKSAASQVDLCPPIGSWMTGFAARTKPTTGMHDPIMARAVLLDDGVTQLVIVVCDLIGFTSAVVADMRKRIQQASGIPAANVLISCTHTHSGPTSMPFRGVMGIFDQEWFAAAQGKIVDLVASLPAMLQPAQLAHAVTHIAQIGYNRQDAAHSVDDELNALAIETTDGAAIATLANYGTHPVVLGPSNLLFSADYPGEVARALSAARGGIGMYLQGTCGDIDPVVYRDRGWGSGTFDDTREMGERIAAAALSALRDAPRTADVTLGVRSRMLPIPLDALPTPAALVALAATFEADRQQGVQRSDAEQEGIALAMQDWLRELQGALSVGAVLTHLPAELFIAAINDVRIVGVPFETYTDIGVRVKQALRPFKTLFAGYANGLFGYCPTTWAKDQGGYGPDSSARWFPHMLTAVGYGADDLIVRESAELEKLLASAGSANGV
jgi:neutral ceramidase